MKRILIGDIKVVLNFEREYHKTLIETCERYNWGSDSTKQAYIQERECIIAEIERIAKKLGIVLE